MSQNTTTRLNDGADLEIAQPEDFGISRDGEGDLVPVKQRIPGTEMAVKCRPLVGGAVDDWEDVLEGSNPEDDRVDEFFREYIEEGIGSEGINDAPDYLVPALIEAVKNSSGYEVFQHLKEEQERERMKVFEQMENVPEDLLMKVLDMDEDELEDRFGDNPELEDTATPG